MIKTVQQLSQKIELEIHPSIYWLNHTHCVIQMLEMSGLVQYISIISIICCCVKMSQNFYQKMLKDMFVTIAQLKWVSQIKTTIFTPDITVHSEVMSAFGYI